MSYSYDITARPAELGGGWRLRLLEDGEEMGGGVFPMPGASTDEVMTWWNTLNDAERTEWLDRGATSPAGAYHGFLLAEEYAAAEAEGQTWVERHQGQEE